MASSTTTYLRNLRKGELTEFAEISDLKEYADLKKSELEAALDKHLRANSSIFSGEKRLGDYYKRLFQPARVSSPVKKEPKAETSSAASEEKKTTRRRKTSTEADDTETEKTPASTTAIAARTPARSPLSFSSLPPSPAVVTDAIDRQTTIVREKVSDAWTKSGISQRSDALRSALSSVKSIETIIVLLELVSLSYELIPLRYLTTFPAVDTIATPEFSVKMPDLFVLITGAFWAPFLLWALTSLALPLTVAYFFNLSLRSQASHSHSTRRASATAGPATFDPLVYNIAKALISYLVYANHFTFWDVFSHFSVEKVNVSIPGQWPGLVTGSAIGILTSLYEAILKK
ncbi:hypothetical protein BGW36DRAFT_19280 [Talaromyces proteolyticus]|uniref:Uncharacterized protein n=1 Tax=Talaromyces proteolyticus TaxID=1131652 RepID=A0AAD4Q1Q2_9EURO|nr:uncharacterized protein BGW36DRAFT_19280 [Talaromyces proteolyticus]KAH8705895.1 hypothetical protein BGW36DRAFT_19280 [Talaromyces proteolyticus]